MPTYPKTFSYNGQSRASTSNLLARYSALSITKLVVLGVANLPLLRAAPTYLSPYTKTTTEEPPLTPKGPALWIYLSVAVVLVLLGGAFAGLTIALMGQDEIYLQVIEKSGEDYEKKHAAKVLRLLQRGKHWVLVTLLLGNVITNETLPIVLDRSLGGGWPAVLGSTALIVIFGEIIPQSICVRYGLPIGAYMSPLVQFLMYLLAPVAWPTAKLLDRLLGQDHGTTYKKAGLKTLVTLHKTLGAAGEQLNSDEVTIISAVLDLKAKSVGSIMTPMEDVFTMSADTVLDEATMDIILSAGYSRIPIYAPKNPQNFVGMLLVKILITYDPEDCKRVRDFALATLPETRAETSCLDIVNFFQEGKSHMVLVSEFPGEDTGALGVVTLEDVIEELIGEEIIDESDVFIDVHKAIRRINPAPRYRVPKGEVFAPTQSEQNVIVEEDLADLEDKQNHKSDSVRRTSDTDALKINRAPSEQNGIPAKVGSPRRASSTMGGSDREGPLHRSVNAETLGHLKHLGPSNVASRPRQTRFQTVKIKPGADSGSKTSVPSIPAKDLPAFAAARGAGSPGGATSGKSATDEVLNVQASYGTMNSSSKPPNNHTQSQEQYKNMSAQREPNANNSSARTASAGSVTTTGSLPKHNNSSETYYLKKTNNVARSGSITENIVDAGGIKKTVLETTSSSSDIDEDEDEGGGGLAEMSTQSLTGGGQANDGNVAGSRPRGAGGRKKRRRRKRKPTAAGEEDGPGEENQPLLSGE